MPVYYMMECYGPMDKKRAQVKTVKNAKGINWMTGKTIDSKIPTPVKVELDDRGGIMMPMFKSGILLWSDELIAAVRESGVDNIVCYPAEIYHPKEDKVYENYKAVNIIGLVLAADMAESKAVVHGTPYIDVDFDSLTIDPEKAKDYLLFRLGECVSGIVVQETVKQHCEKHNIKYINWVDPKDWIG